MSDNNSSAGCPKCGGQAACWCPESRDTPRPTSCDFGCTGPCHNSMHACGACEAVEGHTPDCRFYTPTVDTPRPETISEMRDEEMGDDYEFAPGIADVARLHGMTVTGQPLPTVAEARNESQAEMHERLIREWAIAGFMATRNSAEEDAAFQVRQNLAQLLGFVRRERDTEHLALIAAVREWQEAFLAYDTMDRNRWEYSHIEMKKYRQRLKDAQAALLAFPLPTPEAVGLREFTEGGPADE